MLLTEKILKEQSLDYYQKIGFHYPTNTIQKLEVVEFRFAWDEMRDFLPGYRFKRWPNESEDNTWGSRFEVFEELIESSRSLGFTNLLTESGLSLGQELGTTFSCELQRWFFFTDSLIEHFMNDHYFSHLSPELLKSIQSFNAITKYIIASSEKAIQTLESNGLFSAVSLDIDDFYVIIEPSPKYYTVGCPICETINPDIAWFEIYKDRENNFITENSFNKMVSNMVKLNGTERDNEEASLREIWNLYDCQLTLFFCHDHGLYGHSSEDFKQNYAKDFWSSNEKIEFVYGLDDIE